MNLIGSAHYVISMDKNNISKEALGYLGKIRSENSGTEYNLYNEGENPVNTQIPEIVRNKLAAIQFVKTYNINRKKVIMKIECPEE